MRNNCKIGDIKVYTRKVSAADIAAFESGMVHAVYATFAIARDAEWAGRLFVLDIKDDDEEGIGTFVDVKHHSPAMVGDTVTFTATLTELYKNVVNCSFTAHVGERLIADGHTGQKILKRERLEQYFSQISGK